MFNFSYLVSGSGWADANIGDDGGSVSLRVSYLHDSLRQLAEATCDLLTGATTATVVFMDEPGEHQLVLDLDNAALHYQVRWFHDWASWDMYPKDAFSVLLQGTCPLTYFVGTVLAVLRTILDTHGIDGYKALWDRHDFPQQGLSRLAALANA